MRIGGHEFDHSTRHRPFPIDGPLEPSNQGSISNGFRDIQW